MSKRVYKNPTEYIKRITRLSREISKGTGDVVLKTAEAGARLAQSQAPVDTGAIIRNIYWKKSSNHQAWVVQKNPGKENPARYGIWRGKPFNYAYAMAVPGVTAGAWNLSKQKIETWGQHIRSGDPLYLLHSAIYIRKELKKNIRLMVGRAIKTK